MNASDSTSSTSHQSTALPQLVLVLITMVWGGTFLVVQTALQSSDPFALVGIRFALAALFFSLATYRHLHSFTRTEIIAGILIGVGLFLGYTLQTMGLQTITSSKSAFLTALYVPFVPLIQLVLFKIFPRPGAVLGILLAFVGTIMLTSYDGVDLNLGRGEILTIIGAFCLAGEILLISAFSRRGSPRRITALQLATVAVIALLTSAVSGERLPTLNSTFLVCILSLAAASALIQFGMTWAQGFVSATKATLIYAMEPIWAALIGAIAGERLGLWQGAGGALIVMAVVVSELKFRRRLPLVNRNG